MPDLAYLAAAVGLGDDQPGTPEEPCRQPHLMQHQHQHQQPEQIFLREPPAHDDTMLEEYEQQQLQHIPPSLHVHHMEHSNDDSMTMENHELHQEHDEGRNEEHDEEHQEEHHEVHQEEHDEEHQEEHDEVHHVHHEEHHEQHHEEHHQEIEQQPPAHMDHLITDHDVTLNEAVAAAIDSSPVDPLALAQHKEQIFIKLYKDKAVEAALLKKKLEQKSAEVKSLKSQLAQLRRTNKANSHYHGSRMMDEPKATPTATEATTDDKKPAATISIAVAQNPKYQYKYVRHVKWEERFQELVQYKLKNGHCNVPKSFAGPLHAWVRKQRVDRKAYNISSGGGDMCQERIDALDSIGFTWVIGSNQPNESKWQESFDCLIQFKLKEGHCSVPKVYAAKLHKWVENQRHRRKLLEHHGPQKAKGMTWERVQKLEAIGFWENKKRQGLNADFL